MPAARRTRRTFRAREGYDPVEVLKFAHDHLISARILFESGYRSLDSAAYLAHLAFELLAKASLLHLSGEFPAEHSLGRLCLDLRGRGLRFKLSRRAQKGFILLTRFETAKYPAPPASVEVGDEDFPFLMSLWQEAISQIPSDLRNAYSKSDPTTKGGRLLMAKPGNSPLHRAT